MTTDSCPNTPPGTQVNASGCTDTDGDGVKDASDNCPLVSNADQANADGDNFGNACDGDYVAPIPVMGVESVVLTSIGILLLSLWWRRRMLMSQALR